MLLKSKDLPILPNVFNDFFRDWSTSNFSETNTTLPAVNIKESENDFIVDVAVPGMDKKDFKIDLDNDILTISSEKTTNTDNSNDNYTRKEYSYMSFKRSFTLPKGVVDSDKISASYKNGELKITIPKLEEAKPKPAKLIEVK
ncbi:Hsp20/alpha crystallin family protein [Polaribacter aestuariivivens]|uniref:Hsp20/alpha crystallin family protein n=1 Tax=Polaribacter aestuariivivens TaxID=2304626 RepID=A0A5S3N815_9FLAO|nr:Hsp20/alpha crystallin family protein [Polaribacter aestuariivivens]TMM31277.1 Hsp20/alpha crystallin family protein [Polaribacter aestuariivivens]